MPYALEVFVAFYPYRSPFVEVFETGLRKIDGAALYASATVSVTSIAKT